MRTLLSERLRTIKKRKVMLLSDSERSKRRITKKKVAFCTQREKGDMLQSGFLSAKREGKYVEKWLSKVLKKSFVLLQAVARLP